MFKVEQEYNGYIIDLGNAYRGQRHLKVRSKSKEATVEALKHYFAIKHNKKICAFCQDKKEAKNE